MDRYELRERLEEAHERVERELSRLLSCAQMADAERMQAQFASFEEELRAHFAMEEQQMFPLFEREAPEQTAKLRAEHQAIRVRLDRLAVDLELHAIDHACLNELIALLKSHSQHEHASLYPWIDSRLERHAKAAMVERMAAEQHTFPSAN